MIDASDAPRLFLCALVLGPVLGWLLFGGRKAPKQSAPEPQPDPAPARRPQGART